MARQGIPWLLYLLVLAMVGAVLAWNTEVRYREFSAYQQRLMKSAVNGTAAQLEIFIGELRRSVHLFADTERERLAALAANPDDEQILEQLNAATRRHFPEAFAFTVADRGGAPLLTDFDGLIGEVCLKDLQTFAADRAHSKVYVHPHPTTYHFDIMVDREGDGHPAGLFFVSFRTELLTRLLGHGQLPGHELLLLKQDIPGLIELTAGGARIELGREFKLSPEEISRIGYTVPVNGTLWNLVDLPDAKLYPAMRAALWRETGLILLAFVSVTGMVMWLYQRAQAKRRDLAYRYQHDPVTGLPNQQLFMERLARMTGGGRERRAPFTLLLIDLGRFRRLKGTFFEHRADDALMQAVAERLQKALGAAEIVARIGDSDYAALLPEHDTGRIESLAGKVVEAMKQPFGAGNDLVLPNPCAGYARFPEDGTDAYALIRHAGTRLYAARQRQAPAGPDGTPPPGTT